MQIKTISYHRVVNLGNYESRRLEMSAELREGEDVEAALTSLAELVEQKAAERYDLILDASELRKEIRNLQAELKKLQAEKSLITGEDSESESEPDSDDIPFEDGGGTSSSDTPDSF